MTHEEIKKLLGAINVAWGGDEAEVIITKEVELPEGATMHLFKCGVVESSAISYKDGSLFVIDDWQSARPESYEDIKDFTWVSGADGRRAVILNGLPRLFS
jgi:hypothetical protein